jgi:hypothetical protein
MLGNVPFSFEDRDAAKKAAGKFKEKTVWILKTPAFDTKIKTDYNSCPLKAVVLLQSPSKLTAVPPTSTNELGHPSKYIEVGLDLKGLLGFLSSMQFDKTSSRPGSVSKESKVFDLCGKKLKLTDPKTVDKNGKRFTVSELECVDASGKIKVSVWGTAYAAVGKIPNGEGITLVGVTATRENGEVKLNLWPSAHVLRGGDPAQSLTSLDASSLQQVVLLTATFVPSHAPIDVDKDAHPACAAALAAAAGCSEDVVFQMNHGFFDAPARQDAMFTQDKRLFVSCRFRDRTGGVDVEVIAAAVPSLYGCKDEAELMDKLEKGELESVKVRVNVRGVLRIEGGVVKRYIGKVGPSPLITKVSAQAMRAVAGLTEITGDLVIPSPVERVIDAPMIGLAVRSDKRPPLAVHRVLFLVQGTRKSQLDARGDAKRIEDQSYNVSSKDLVGYCDYDGMLTYRLDQEAALVLVSAITLAGDAPNSVSANESSFLATIEHMQKISADEKAALVKSLDTEWKSVLLDQPPEGLSPARQEYWEQPASKLRRMESEAVSPIKFRTT